MVDIFDLNNELLAGSLISEYTKYSTYILVKSVFKDDLYNFIAPTVPFHLFAWEDAKNTIKKNSEGGYHFSYYLKKDDQYHLYLNKFKQKSYFIGLIDTYVYKQIYTENFAPLEEYVEADDRTIDTFMQVSTHCFPEWESNSDFCNYLFFAQKQEKSMNFLVYLGNEVAGIGSVFYSTALDIAYITNMGTLPSFRNRGIQKRLLKHISNYVEGKGVHRLYSIVEPNSISHNNFLKQGFETIDTYVVFQKE
ncbi:GNAT family N-acetyltransferase [Candidatus Roizmanbacteria bacterium]|nr:GNAT family N-acetyltransferase [Candidatus Roizmanbacteria bacterium]